MKNAGLTITAFQPSALIRLSSKVTVAETERLRRSATIYDQKMNVLQQITIEKDFIQNVGFSRECEILILTLDGQLHIYNLWNKDQPVNTINLVEGVFDTSVKCVDMSQITFLPGYRFNVTVYSAKRNMWYQLNCNMKQPITSEDWQILQFSSPIKQIPISFDTYRSQMPGSVIISQAYRPSKQIFNIEDGQVEIVVLMQSGNIYKLQQNKQENHQQSHTLLCQTNVIQGSNAQLKFDPSHQFFSVFTPVGQNYLSYNHVQLKSELIDKIIAYKAIPDDEKKEQEDNYTDAIKTIKALTTSGALELEPQIRYYQAKAQFIIKIYDFSAQKLLFDQTVQDLHCQDTCASSIIMESQWCGDSIPTILYKSHNFWNLLAVSRQQYLYYQLCPSNQKPILSTECDGLQIISRYSLQKLQVVHPFTAQMWYQSFAFSESAHLLEAYKTYDQMSFQADDLARQLQQRCKDTSTLILGITQASIQENENIGITMLRAAHYLKIYDKDANTNSLQTFLPLLAPRKDISLKNANFVSQYYAPILQSIFTGQPVQAMFDNQVYYFTPYLCYINSQSQQVNPLWQFDHKNWLSDQLIIAKMIHSTACRLNQAQIYITGQQIINMGLNNLITYLSSTKHFSLAEEICDYWQMSHSILTINYINQLLYLHPKISDKALLKFLNQTRKSCFNISNSQLANVLIMFNRYNLANYLVLKQSIEDSVILNLKMMNFGRAVVASLKSGDKNLILYSIQQAVRGNNGGAELVFMVCQEPQLALLLNDLYKYEGQQNLQDIAEQVEPELYLFKLQFELGKLSQTSSTKDFLEQISKIQDTRKMCKDLEKQIDKAKVQQIVNEAKKLVQKPQDKKQKQENEFTLTIKTQSDLEKISNKAKKLLNKQKKINLKKYFQVDQELYNNSAMNFFDLIDVPTAMQSLIEQQQEIVQQTGTNVIGLTVFDTLCFLYKGFFSELTEGKYDQAAEFIEKQDKNKKEEKAKVNWSKLIQNFIKVMQISPQLQQSAYCQTITLSCNFTPLLGSATKEFKKNFNPYIGYKIAYKIHALSICDKFISMIPNERKQFVYYLTINMRDRCVMIFRHLGKQTLQEIFQEFYANSLAQGTIKRFIYELDVE